MRSGTGTPIYEAAKYFELFQKTVFKGKCAVVTSYNPQAQDVTLKEGVWGFASPPCPP